MKPPIKYVFLIPVFALFIYGLISAIQQKTIEHIRIYGEEINYFKGELLFQKDNYSQVEFYSFSIKNKDSIAQLFALLKTATRTTIDKRINSYATINVRGFTDNRIYCFRVLLPKGGGAVFDQNDCETKYFKKVIGSFSNYKITSYFKDLFLKKGLSLDSLNAENEKSREIQ